VVEEKEVHVRLAVRHVLTKHKLPWCRDELEAALKLHHFRSKTSLSGAPTREDVLRVFTASAIPFIGFGFLDNLLMILAGDYIDAKLGAAFAMSTMAAAGGLLVSIVSVTCPFCCHAARLHPRSAVALRGIPHANKSKLG
jgi:membrane associated rhomboid family serine protease